LTTMWYFSGKGEEMSDVPGEGADIKRAIAWASWWHLGSIAFGSFIIAVVSMLRFVFEYYVKQAEQYKENPVFKCMVCCTRCLLWCLDTYVKFISKNAYIQVALRSKNFCASAWESFYLMVRHAGRFGSATMIGMIMMMVGKACICGTSAWLTLLVVRETYPKVQQPLLPAVVVAVMAYVVASIFLSIYTFSCTAILHCFLLDEDTGGSKFTPKSLQPFLDMSPAEEKPEQAKANDVDAGS